MDDDDDLYGPSETTTEQQKDLKREDDGASDDEPMDEGADSGDEEDEDSESDLEIIIDKPTKPVAQQPPQESKAIKIQPPPRESTSTPSQAPANPLPKPAVITTTFQNGSAYPAQRTSTIDVNGDPVYPPAGKPITQVTIDADLANEQKLWRNPGQDQSDYFNYGFDEFTWEMYRQRQINIAQQQQQQKDELLRMQQTFGMPAMPGANMSGPGMQAGGGMPQGPSGGGMGGAPSGPSGMNGGAQAMMGEQDMQMMMSQMMAQGMDPSQMDFQGFMQMMQGGQGQSMGGAPNMGGGGGFGGPGAQQGGGFQQGNQGGGGGRGGRGGRGRGW